jgi:hypothetical protein
VALARPLLYWSTMRARLGILRAELFAAAGVATVACGGESTRSVTGTNTAVDAGVSGISGSAGNAGVSTGGASGAGMVSGGAAGMTRRQSNTPCENPEPIMGPKGNDTGFVSCNDGGFTHRRERRNCDSIVPRPDPIQGGGTACTMDSDCGDPPSYCGQDLFQIYPLVRCQKGCVSDEDCAQGQICFCLNPIGVCLASFECETDADCPGGLCTMIPRKPICQESNLGVFACQNLNDQCQSYSECFADCRALPTGRECVWEGQCGARPYLIAGEARVAVLVNGSGAWAATSTPSLAGLDRERRLSLARHWSNNGLAEHASIAAFARFSLGLLSLGAPASLVTETARALGDEIAHAELCFGLASAYAGRRIGPGELPHDRAFADGSFFDVVSTAIAEGCVGETLAAAEVTEAAELAADPEVRRVLGRIAEDEKRHAELGWKFLRWALDRAAPNERRKLVAHAGRLVQAELETLTRAPRDDFDPKLGEHGILSPSARHAVRHATLSEVLIPLVTALRSSAGVRPSSREHEGFAQG